MKIYAREEETYSILILFFHWRDPRRAKAHKRSLLVRFSLFAAMVNAFARDRKHHTDFYGNENSFRYLKNNDIRTAGGTDCRAGRRIAQIFTGLIFGAPG